MANIHASLRSYLVPYILLIPSDMILYHSPWIFHISKLLFFKQPPQVGLWPTCSHGWLGQEVYYLYSLLQLCIFYLCKISFTLHSISIWSNSFIYTLISHLIMQYWVKIYSIILFTQFSIPRKQKHVNTGKSVYEFSKRIIIRYLCVLYIHTNLYFELYVFRNSPYGSDFIDLISFFHPFSCLFLQWFL